MSEKINWLQVVLDYGKRNPDVTCGDLLGLSNDYKISELELYIHGNGYYFLYNNNIKKSYMSTSKSNGKGFLEYRENDWEPVPEHILLRLLTEGKEDLV